MQQILVNTTKLLFAIYCFAEGGIYVPLGGLRVNHKFHSEVAWGLNLYHMLWLKSQRELNSTTLQAIKLVKCMAFNSFQSRKINFNWES